MNFKVLPNPWAAIDEKARPCGRVSMDQDEHNPQGGKFIGAKLVAIEVSPKKWRKIGRYIETTQEARYDRTWTFSTVPVEIPSTRGAPTGYYCDRIKRGELIAADPACAAAVGVPFRDPAAVIAASKAARRAEFDAQHGSGAFDALQPPESKSVPVVAPSNESDPTKSSVATKRTATPKE
jgi:hypothetical protein